MIWTPLELIKRTTDFFAKKGIPNPRLDAELLLAAVLRCPRIDLYTDHERQIVEKELTRYREFVDRRSKREPLQYILGETEFWGLKIKVTPDVLIPRPETELLVEEALKSEGTGSVSIEILEIGTGSGCLSIAVAKNLPNSKIAATDIFQEALEVARGNARDHQVDGQIEFHLANIAPWKMFKAQGRCFDLIVSNPPYIATSEISNLQPEVRDGDPKIALDGGEDGLKIICQILEEAPPFLKPSGRLILEIGENQGGKMKGMGPVVETIRKDLAGHDRIAIFKMIS